MVDFKWYTIADFGDETNNAYCNA